jgi:eukaryotic-like serine/threonine-protein kinase
MIGEIIDEKYKITRLIGEGGMGAVFEGENLLISRRVAIKVLHAAMAMNEQTVERFQREARAAGRIGNDHILEVLDLGKLPNGDHYMVLEYLDGEPLNGRIQRLGKMSPEQVAPLMTQVLAGLGAAHDAGIIHRDLKPDNLFVLREKAGQKDYVKIIDFGISKFNPLSGDDAQKKMTQTGAIMGTPYYMSPEQARGSLEADGRSDLYSIGVIIYEAVTGQVPFDGQTINELMFAIALNDPRPIEEFAPDIDPAFKLIVQKAMNKDKDARYQSAAEFADDLRAWMAGKALPVATALDSGSAGPRPTPTATTAAAAVPATSGAAAAGSTTSTWSTSQADAGIPTNKTPIVAATLIGAVVLLGGGTFAAVKLFGDGPAPVEAAADQPPTETPSDTAPLNPAPEAVPPVVKPAIDVDDKAPSGDVPEEAKAPDEASDEAAGSAKSADIEKAAPAPPPPAPAPAPTPKVQAPAPAPKPAPRPAPAKPAPAPPKPAPAPTPKSSFSRFGY